MSGPQLMRLLQRVYLPSASNSRPFALNSAVHLGKLGGFHFAKGHIFILPRQ
jgi:hypothetical protein